VVSVSGKDVAIASSLGRVHRAQELHKLFADFGGGLMVYPVAYIVEFQVSDETRKPGPQLFGRGIKHSQAVGLSGDVKRRLSDLRAFPCGGQSKIQLGGAIIVQRTVKAGALEFRYVVRQVIGFYP
jgi:hypothetical protein